MLSLMIFNDPYTNRDELVFFRGLEDIVYTVDLDQPLWATVSKWLNYGLRRGYFRVSFSTLTMSVTHVRLTDRGIKEMLNEYVPTL